MEELKRVLSENGWSEYFLDFYNPDNSLAVLIDDKQDKVALEDVENRVRLRVHGKFWTSPSDMLEYLKVKYSW